MLKRNVMCALAALLASTNAHAASNGNLLPPMETPKFSQILVQNPYDPIDHETFEVAASNTIGPRGGGEVYIYLY